MRRTERGTLTWLKAANERYETSADTTSYAVATHDGDGQPPFTLAGYNSRGEEVLFVGTDDVNVDSSTEELIANLFRFVRDLVDNKDLLAFLDQALDDVDDEKPPF